MSITITHSQGLLAVTVIHDAVDWPAMADMMPSCGQSQSARYTTGEINIYNLALRLPNTGLTMQTRQSPTYSTTPAPGTPGPGKNILDLEPLYERQERPRCAD
jgi:hypothetical protein